MTASLFGCKKGSSEKIVVLGLGFDQGSTTHPGCKMAPQILRNFSNSLGLSQGYLWNLSKQRKDFEDLSLSDLGDLNYKAHQPRESYFASIRKTIETLTSRQKIPLLLGGDHLASLPVLEAMAGLHSKFQVVQIDAHTDCQRVADGDQPTHANFIRFALNEKPIKKIIQIGVRGYCREVPDFPNHLIQSLPQNLRHHLLPSVPVYLSIDMDGFDPAIAPAVGHPILGGLQFSDLNSILDSILEMKCPILGVDFMEYNPLYDTKNHLGALFGIQALLCITESLHQNLDIQSKSEEDLKWKSA